MPAEIIFDAGIGDVFHQPASRVTRSTTTFWAVWSSPAPFPAQEAVVVLGHTACGAVKGAIDDVVLGNLTAELRASMQSNRQSRQRKFEGEKSTKNYTYVDAVGGTNVAAHLE